MCRVSSFQPKTFILPASSTTPLITKATITASLPVSSPPLPQPPIDGGVENIPRKENVIIDDVTFVYDPARPGSKREWNGSNSTNHDDDDQRPNLLPSSPDRIYQIGNVEPFHPLSLARIFRCGDSNLRDDNTSDDDTATTSITLQLLAPPTSPDSPFLLPSRDTYNSNYSNKDEKVDNYDHNDIGLSTRQQHQHHQILPTLSSFPPFVYETPPPSPKRKLSLIDTLEPPPTPCCKRTIVDFYLDETILKCDKDQRTPMMLLQHSHDHQQRNIFLPFIL